MASTLFVLSGGTYYPMTVSKHLRAQQIARENNLPCDFVECKLWRGYAILCYILRGCWGSGSTGLYARCHLPKSQTFLGPSSQACAAPWDLMPLVLEEFRRAFKGTHGHLGVSMRSPKPRRLPCRQRGRVPSTAGRGAG